MAPSIKPVKLGYTKSLLNLASVFCLPQIGALILLQTGKIVITHVLGPMCVTSFTIAYMLFSVFTIISLYWTAFTEACSKKDLEWIDVRIRKTNRVWAIISSVVLLVLITSKWIFAIWVGEMAHILFFLSLALAVSVICCVRQTIKVYSLNEIGKVRLQMIIDCMMPLIIVLLAIYLCERIRLTEIATPNTVVYLVTGFFCFRQGQFTLKSNLSNFAAPDF
jgi:hypothetical protein